MLGTLLDNTRDMMTKGRSKFHISKGKSHPGESHPQTSLTWKAVRIIRAKYASGKHTQKEIGKMYGLCPAAISAITLNKTWKE
jgi:DNA-binding MarR family transcriptional regulator